MSPFATAPPPRRDGVTSADYTVRDQQRMERAQNYFAWQAELVLSELERTGSRRVFEIGCGVGNFTRHLTHLDLVYGIDPVEECIAHHRQRFGGDGGSRVRSEVLDVLDPALPERLAPFGFDAVICLNVLEHISDDELALRHMHRVLGEAGRAIFLLPAFEALFGPIDSNLGHFRRYSRAGFAALARRTGFEPLTLRYFNTIGCLGWWVNARILKKTEQSEQQIALFDSAIVPVLRAVESRIAPPFGQSLFAVLEKR